MTAPTIVGTGAFAAGTGPVNPTLPAGLVDGDWLFLVVSSANEPVATPAGWAIEPPAPLGSGTAGAIGGHRLSLFRRVFATGVTAPSVADSGNYTAARIFAVRGADTVNVVNSGYDPGGTGSDPVAAAITTTVANCLVLLIGECDRDIASSNTQFLVPLAPSVDGAAMTEIIDDHTSQGAGGGIAVAWAVKTTAGAIADTTFRFGSNLLPSHHIHMALAPASGGPSPLSASAAGSLPLTGTSTAVIGTGAAAQVPLAIAGSATGQVRIGAQAGGSISLSGSASATSRIAAQAAGALSLVGSAQASGQAQAAAAGAGILPLSGAASASVRTIAFAAASMPLTGAGSAVVRATAAAAGTITLAGSALASTSALSIAAASGVLPLSGAAQARVGIAGSGSGQLVLAGTASASEIEAEPEIIFILPASAEVLVSLQAQPETILSLEPMPELIFTVRRQAA